MKRVIYLLIFLFFAAACKETYEMPPTALLQISLLNSVTESDITPVVSALGAKRDSLWIKEEALSTLLLPLSSADSSAYLLSFDATLDTVIFYHRTELKYASMETGFYFEYKLDSIYTTHNRIESLQIVDSLVTTQWHENIQLYLRPLSTGNN